MSSRARGGLRMPAVIIASALVSACSRPPVVDEGPWVTTPPATAISHSRIPQAGPATVTPPPPRTPATSATPASATSAVPVQVRALGNLFVRRGPDLAFNAIGLLVRDQVVTPNGRDVLSEWVRIPLPGDSTGSGWISIMSDFTFVSGDVKSLAEIEPDVWPELAFVRNCTYHEMVLKPGGLSIPGVQNFPHNDVRVNPGTYSAIDIELEEYPSVLDIEIREGSSIDIIVDGNGEKRKCPAQ